MEIEYDPDKDAINIAKHGVSLTFGEHVFDDAAHVIVPTGRIADGEDRLKAIGYVHRRL